MNPSHTHSRVVRSLLRLPVNISAASRALRRTILVTVLAGSLAACAGLGKTTAVSDIAAELPTQFSQVAPLSESQALDAQWWRAFGDTQLDALVERGLEHNSNLIIGAARLREAAAVLKQTRAGQIPDMGVFVGGNRQRAASTTTPSATVVSDGGSFGVSIGYEVDLWGRLSAQTDAARQRYLAQGYTQAALQLSIAAELTRGYLAAQAQTRARDILADNVELLAEAVSLSERRFALGAISELDMQRSRSELEDSRAQLAQAVAQLNATRRALLVLAGEWPTTEAMNALEVQSKSPTPSQLPQVPLGLPSELLERRPDLRAAEANLAAARADVSAARRAFLPSLQLTGQTGRASGDLSDLFAGPHLSLWSIGAELVQAIFEGGARRGAVEAARARQGALVEQYRDTVRDAFRDVLDALDARDAAAQVHQARLAQSEALSHALRLAQRRYDEGYDDFLSVLDARRSLLQARLAVSQAELSAGSSYVDLALALGGGWNKDTSTD